MVYFPNTGTNSAYVSILSDPTLYDTDSGGIDDGYEKTNGWVVLDPFDPTDDTADFDYDGLSNLEEVQLGTAIGNVDSDGDGITDEAETAWSGMTDTNGIYANPTVSNAWDWTEDYDGDGLTLEQEYELGTDPSDPSDANQTNNVTDVTVSIGNPNNDWGYVYEVVFSGPNLVKAASADNDVVSTVPVKLLKGCSYAFSLTRRRNEMNCGYPADGYEVQISGKDLVIKDPLGVLGDHSEDDSTIEFFENGTATGVVHVVLVEVEDITSLAVSAPSTAIYNTNGFLDISGRADWIIRWRITPLAAKTNVSVRMIQTVTGSKHRTFKDTGQNEILDASQRWYFDGKNDLFGQGIWSDFGEYYSVQSWDTPELGSTNYSEVKIDYAFEDFIQYKVDEWTTLQKGSWETHGHGLLVPDGQGGYTCIGGTTNTLTSPFVPHRNPLLKVLVTVKYYGNLANEESYKAWVYSFGWWHISPTAALCMDVR